MEINENIKIEAIDKRNICILKRQSIKGEEKWKRLGYYSSAKRALKGLVDREILGTGLKDFKTICDKIDSLYEYIDSLDIRVNKNDLKDFLGE